MYEIGIVSKDKNRLTAGALMLHAAGIRFGYNKVAMFESGKLSREFRSFLNSSQGLHAENGIALHSGSAIRCPIPTSKYSVGFFNLDDPAGWRAFAQVMGERALSATPKTNWQLGTAAGNKSDHVAVLHDRNIHVGCTVTGHTLIGHMITAINSGLSETWALRDEIGVSCGFSATSDPQLKRLLIKSYGVMVTIDQLKEMFAATA